MVVGVGEAGFLLRLFLDGILFCPPIPQRIIGVNMNILRQIIFPTIETRKWEKTQFLTPFFCPSVGGNFVSIGFLGENVGTGHQ